MTDTTRADFDTWFLKNYGSDTALARMNYMKFNINDVESTWQSATLTEQGKRKPLNNEQRQQISVMCSRYNYTTAELIDAIEAAQKITATPHHKARYD